jgi:hypothetical protein
MSQIQTVQTKHDLNDGVFFLDSLRRPRTLVVEDERRVNCGRSTPTQLTNHPGLSKLKKTDKAVIDGK